MSDEDICATFINRHTSDAFVSSSNLKMYASNEDEDWVYLQQTPPMNAIFQGVVHRADRKRSNSSSSSSITSCSSQSNRSISLSSICSTELEQAQMEDAPDNTRVLSSPIDEVMYISTLKRESCLKEPKTTEDSLPSSDRDNDIRTAAASELASSQSMISTATEPVSLPDNSDPTIETQTNTKESDVCNVESNPGDTLSLPNSTSSHSESLSVPQNLRSRRSAYATTQTRQSPDISRNIKWPTAIDKKDTLISCTCIVVLLMSSFMLGQIVAQWDQSTVSRISRELDRTNQRLSAVQDIPMGTFEEKLTKQLEDKLQNMVHQQLAWHDYEKDSFVNQIGELRQILNLTNQNLTNTIYRLTDENGRLQERIKSLEHRLQVAGEGQPEPSFEDNNCTNTSTSTLDKFMASVFKQTVSIAANTSINLSGLFEHLSASVSNLVDHRHDYVNKSRQKLSDLAGSPTAGKVQSSFRQGLDNLSSSFRKAKGTYVSWLKFHVQRRETASKQPWRWGFRRTQDRTRASYQTPRQEHKCQSKFGFSMNKIRSMTNWMIKMFRA